MALVVTKNLTDLWDSEATTGWTGISTTTYSGFQREGSNCEGLQVSNETQTGYRSFTAFDMSAAAVYVWFFVAGQMDTVVNGGIRIVLGDGTNRIAYHVGGSDSLRFNIGTIWSCLMIDGANPPTDFTVEAGTEASLDFANITQVGVAFKTLSKSLGGADNCFWDIARWGTGLTITGGGSTTQGTFAELASDDYSTAAGKAYGIIREIQPGVFGVQGQLVFGDVTAATNSYFEDVDATVIFEANGAGDTFYSMSVVGGTGTNEFILGEKVGTGDTAKGAKGCTLQSSGPSVDLDLDHTSIVTHLYGCKLFKLTGTLTFSTTTTDEFIGCTVDQCAQVIANQAIIRNCVFSGYAGVDSALLWNSTINIKNCQFNGNTDVTNSPAGIEHTAISSVTYDNLTFSGNDFDILNSSAGLVTVTKTNGSDPVTTRNTGGGSVVITAAFTLTLTDIPTGVQVTIVNSSTRTELQNSTTTTGVDVTYTHAGGETVDVLFMANAYDPNSSDIYNLPLPNSNSSIKISLASDSNYDNPA